MSDSPPSDPPFLVEQRARSAALLRELAAAPVAAVTGVVSEKHVGAAKLRGDTQWTITLVLERWRVGDGAVRNEPLVLRELGDEARLEVLRETTRPYAVLRVDARVVERGDGAQALIERVVGVVRDGELEAVARELQRTVAVSDATLGTLTLDRRYGWYTGRARWGAADVEFSLDAAKPADLERTLAAAHALWREQARWDARIRDYVVAELLDLKNDTWLGDDEEPLAAADLLARVVLERITVYPDGRFEFWFGDGDVFWGHSIQVRCDLAKGPREAVIAG